jgi:nitrate reductase cytochrome c-type subunit
LPRGRGSNPARGAIIQAVAILQALAFGILLSACSDTANMQQLNARCQAGNQSSCTEMDAETQKQALRQYPETPPAIVAPPGAGQFGVQ